MHVRVEGPVLFCKDVNEIGACSGKLVIHGPARGDDAFSSFTGAAAGEKANDIGDGIIVERLAISVSRNHQNSLGGACTWPSFSFNFS